MRILIYGTGPLGSLAAVKFKQSNKDVTILARGGKIDSIKQNGITIYDLITKQEVNEQINVIGELKPDDIYDLIIVVMRKNNVLEILPILEKNKSPTILFTGNNVNGWDEYIDGFKGKKERILLGFLHAAGYWDKNRFITLGLGESTVTFGDFDGTLESNKINTIKDLLRESGFNPIISDNIDAWLKSHAALILPLAAPIYMCDSDNFRMAKTKDALLLGIRGIKELMKVLKTLNYPILPKKFQNLARMPEWFLYRFIKKLLADEKMKVAMAGHARNAKDEMQALEKEFRMFINKSGVKTKYFDLAVEYLNNDLDPIPIGKGKLRIKIW